jgi:outer membrane protein
MIRYIFIICLIVVCDRTAWADSYRLNLKEAINMAVDKNNLLRAAGFASEAARQGIGVSTSRYYPSISFDESFNVSNSPTQTFMMKLDEGRFTQNDFLINNLNNPGTEHDFKTALTVRQTIFDPSIAATRDLAVQESQIQSTRLDGIKQETAFKVFKLYLEVQKAQARIRAVEQAISSARESLRLAGVRSKAGTGLRSDELRARTHLSLTEQQLISAQNNLTIARMELADVIGLKDSDSIDITESMSVAVSPPQTTEELVASALENRNEYKLSQTEYEKADAALRLANSSYFPTVGAYASYQLNSRENPFNADNDSWSAGVALTWQLFDGFRRSSERDRALAEKSAAAEMREHAKRETSLRVRESYLRSTEMGKRLDVAKNALQDAEETVRLLTKRFENSLAIMIELLDAQSALNQTRNDLVDSEANYALAKGYIYFTAGTFLREMTK